MGERKDWADLEVVKRVLTVGTAGELDAPDIDIPPYAEGTATIEWKTGARKEDPQKDHQSVKVTTTLVISKIAIDAGSIKVPEPDPQLPGMETGKNRRRKKDGDVATAGEATGAVVRDIQKRSRSKGTARAKRPPRRV